MLTTVMVISIIIIFVVIIISVITTNKAYKFEHTVDPHPDEEASNDKK